MTSALWQTALPGSADQPSRWGRTAMASYFVVAATLDIAAHQHSALALLSGAGATIVLEHAGPFMADIAVAASLLLYLGDGARRAVRRHA